MTPVAKYFESKKLDYTAKSTFIPFNIESTGARNVHTVYIRDLSPDTEYRLEIFYDGKLQYESVYRTLPTNDMSRNVVVAIGGDVGINDFAINMTRNLETISPDVIIIGGDGAYDNGMENCYYKL